MPWRRAFALAPLLIAVLTALPGLAGCSGQQGQQRELAVAAAADLKFALDEVVTAFEHEHPDIKVRVTYGASGTFFQQLSEHAPFDVFLSADMEYPRKLVEQGLDPFCLSLPSALASPG